MSILLVPVLAGLVMTTMLLLTTSSNIFTSAYADLVVDNPSDYYPCFQPCIYDVTIGNVTYPIEYQVWNESGNTTALAKLDKITANIERKSLLVEVTSDNNGTLILYIPKAVLNTANDGFPFTLLINGNTADYEQAYEPQWATEFDHRQIQFRMDSNTKIIEIIGENIVPEFGSLSVVIAAISIGTVLVVSSRKFGRWYK